MAQPQSQVVPPRAFSPPQHSPSPTASQSGFAPPPNTRVLTGGPPSRPDSPYTNSPYAMSPAPGAGTPGSAGSPLNMPSPTVQGNYGTPTPYTNGHITPSGLNLTNAQSSSTPLHTPLHTPQPVQAPTPVPPPQYTAAMLAAVVPTQQPLAQSQGTMGPPQRPADRPQKDYEYDVTDTLAGTGIDLRAEEQYVSNLYSNDANSWHPEARAGFPQLPPGPKSSFYGAGSANQPAERIGEQDQAKFLAQQAERAWADSALRIGMQRTVEIGDPFLLVASMHRRADKIAREHHLQLNLDLKNSGQQMGKMKLPNQFCEPIVRVETKQGPDSTMISTTGSFIPQDAFLVDQLALLSIATKMRLRDMIEDAEQVASHRQKTSHGDVPEEWTLAAAPVNIDVPEAMEVDSAVTDGVQDPGTTQLKRPASLSIDAPTKKVPKIASYMTTTMRDLAKQEREWEEARLRKRQKRKDGIADTGSAGSRAGSAAPGTPGSVAPEADKGLTKKEIKKTQAAKAAEANNHANQNLTSSMFAGLGGKSSLFGGKKKKTYDWMNAGRGGSGTSTPKGTAGGGKGAVGPGGATASGNVAMTTEGRNRLGTWREDKEKGKNIQLRDWISVLERDGREAKALQKAYIDLDLSNPK